MRQKLTVAALCLLFILCLLTGCRESEPVKLVKSELTQIQKLDEKTIRSFISYADMAQADDSSDSDEDALEAIRLFFRDFSYQVLSSSIEEDRATVNVEIENIDARALAHDLCLELITRSSSPDAEDAQVGSYFALLRDILAEGDYELVQTTAHFNLKRSDDIWQIQSTETLENELVGGFITNLSDPDLVTPEEITEKVLSSLREHTPEQWVSYLGLHDIFSTYSTESGKVDLALAGQIAKCFSYKIDQVTVKDDQADAAVLITSLDLDHVLDVYLEKLLEYASTTEAVRATDTELADKTAALLAECLNSNTKTCTKSVTIHFTHNGCAWEMNLDDSFSDALLGDMTKAVERFQENALTAG